MEKPMEYHLDEWFVMTPYVAGLLHPAIRFDNNYSVTGGLKVIDCIVQSAKYWCPYAVADFFFFFFLGGGHTAPPFLYMCSPFWNLKKKKKKKKMCRNTEMCGIPPPPRLGLARLSTLVALRKKKCRSPPPTAHQLFWDFRGWRR